MAMVYLARQTDLDRFVALKELAAFHASDAAFAQRFLRESRVAGSLSHPNIVTVHDYFEHDGRPYIAMEYVERGSLRPFVGHLTLAQIGGVLEGLLAGLALAGQNGIVHRDLKPENLMVTADGRVKIADFGIAKATGQIPTGAFVTATGTTVGTPVYMAPEQAMGHEVGPWSDLYSVGCMAVRAVRRTAAVPRLRGADGDPAAASQRADPRRQLARPVRRPRDLRLDRAAAGQGSDAARAVGGRRVGRARGADHRAGRAALAPVRAAVGARRRGRRGQAAHAGAVRDDRRGRGQSSTRVGRTSLSSRQSSSATAVKKRRGATAPGSSTSIASSSRSQRTTFVPGEASRTRSARSREDRCSRSSTTASGRRRPAIRTSACGRSSSPITSMPSSCRTSIIPRRTIGSRLPSSTRGRPW